MKKLFASFGLLVLINLSLYFFILFFHNSVPLDQHDYWVTAYHFFKDQRIDGGKFNFLRALGQYDAQWYLYIAANGYPEKVSKPTLSDWADKSVVGGIAYRFFPLYPLVLSIFDRLLNRGLEFSAFLLSNILLCVNFFSLYYVVFKKYGESIAWKTALLVFVFPFSIFYRSYFSEGLLLFFIIWFSHFLLQERFLLAAVFLGFAGVSRGNVLPVFILYFLVLLRAILRKKLNWGKALLCCLVCSAPVVVWMGVNFVRTGNGLYFYEVQQSWFDYRPAYWILAFNLVKVFLFPILPLSGVVSSQIEVVSMILIGVLLLKSRKYLDPQLWLISFIFFLVPLITMPAFLRYQITSFPLAIFCAAHLDKWHYWQVVMFMWIGLMITSLYFVNWWWIG